jgi:hypothetical protein
MDHGGRSRARGGSRACAYRLVISRVQA